MRLRRRNKKTIDIKPEAVYSERTIETETDTETETDIETDFNEDESASIRKIPKEKSKKKPSKKSARENTDSIINAINAPASLFRKIVQNPNFSSQMMVIVFSLLSDNVPMARPLDNMSTAIDKARNINEVLTSTMQSVKVATEVPKQIRRLLK